MSQNYGHSCLVKSRPDWRNSVTACLINKTKNETWTLLSSGREIQGIGQTRSKCQKEKKINTIPKLPSSKSCPKPITTKTEAGAVPNVQATGILVSTNGSLCDEAGISLNHIMPRCCLHLQSGGNNERLGRLDPDTNSRSRTAQQPDHIAGNTNGSTSTSGT